MSETEENNKLPQYSKLEEIPKIFPYVRLKNEETILSPYFLKLAMALKNSKKYGGINFNINDAVKELAKTVDINRHGASKRFKAIDPWIVQGFVPLHTRKGVTRAASNIAHALYARGTKEYKELLKMGQEFFKARREGGIDLVSAMEMGVYKTFGDTHKLLREDNLQLNQKIFAQILCDEKTRRGHKNSPNSQVIISMYESDKVNIKQKTVSIMGDIFGLENIQKEAFKNKHEEGLLSEHDYETRKVKINELVFDTISKIEMLDVEKNKNSESLKAMSSFASLVKKAEKNNSAGSKKSKTMKYFFDKTSLAMKKSGIMIRNEEVMTPEEWQKNMNNFQNISEFLFTRIESLNLTNAGVVKKSKEYAEPGKKNLSVSLIYNLINYNKMPKEISTFRNLRDIYKLELLAKTLGINGSIKDKYYNLLEKTREQVKTVSM